MKKTICIDFGHCETAATLATTNEVIVEKKIVSRPVVYDLHVDNTDLVTYTEIGLTYEQIDKLSNHLDPKREFLAGLGEIPIGKSIPYLNGKGEIFRYFKTPPKNFNTVYTDSAYAKKKGLSRGAIMACYAYALIERIFFLNEDKLGSNEDKAGSTLRDNIDVIVGCPTSSEWTDDVNRSKYEKLLKDAMGVGTVRIVPESRAAMFSSIEKKDNQRAVSAQDGAVVLDFGSSTADCTYMLLGKSKFEFSWPLGAREIESLIKEDVKTRIADYQNIEFDPYVDSETEKQFRQAKEEYFIGKRPKPYGTYKDIKTQNTKDVQVELNDEYMTKIAQELKLSIPTLELGTVTGSWAEICTDFMRHAQESISNIIYQYTLDDGSTATASCSFTKVVLTGGASRMAFIEKIAKSVFPHNVEVICERNPSKTVSSGLGWVACSESEMENCINNAKNNIKNDKEANINWLIDACKYDIYKFITTEVMGLVNKWANDSAKYKTQAELQTSIDKFTSSIKAQNNIGMIIEKNVEKWKGQYAAKLKRAVNEQTPNLFSNELASSLIVPDDVWEKLQVYNIRIDEINLTQIIQSVQIRNTFGQWLNKVVRGQDTAQRLQEPRKKSKREASVPVFKNALESNKQNAYSQIERSFAKYKIEYPIIVKEAVEKAMNIAALKYFEWA